MKYLILSFLMLTNCSKNTKVKSESSKSDSVQMFSCNDFTTIYCMCWGVNEIKNKDATVTVESNACFTFNNVTIESLTSDSAWLKCNFDKSEQLRKVFRSYSKKQEHSIIDTDNRLAFITCDDTLRAIIMILLSC